MTTLLRILSRVISCACGWSVKSQSHLADQTRESGIPVSRLALGALRAGRFPYRAHSPNRGSDNDGHAIQRHECHPRLSDTPKSVTINQR